MGIKLSVITSPDSYMLSSVPDAVCLGSPVVGRVLLYYAFRFPVDGWLALCEQNTGLVGPTTLLMFL